MKDGTYCFIGQTRDVEYGRSVASAAFNLCAVLMTVEGGKVTGREFLKVGGALESCIETLKTVRKGKRSFKGGALTFDPPTTRHCAFIGEYELFEALPLEDISRAQVLLELF